MCVLSMGWWGRGGCLTFGLCFGVSDASLFLGRQVSGHSLFVGGGRGPHQGRLGGEGKGAWFRSESVTCQPGDFDHISEPF